MTRVCWLIVIHPKAYVPLRIVEASENICFRINAAKTGLDRLVPGSELLSGYGETLKEREFTLRLKVKSGKKNIPDFMRWGDSWIVSETFKTHVEQLEPGIHEFFEIEIALRSGQPAPQRHFVFNICNLVEAVCVEEPQMTLTDGAHGGTYYSINYLVDVIVDLTKVEGKHVWRDRWQRGHTFVSEEFRRTMEAAGIDDMHYWHRVIARKPVSNLH